MIYFLINIDIIYLSFLYIYLGTCYIYSSIISNMNSNNNN